MLKKLTIFTIISLFSTTAYAAVSDNSLQLISAISAEVQTTLSIANEIGSSTELSVEQKSHISDELIQAQKLLGEASASATLAGTPYENLAFQCVDTLSALILRA